jgi:hypothetical protein
LFPTNKGYAGCRKINGTIHFKTPVGIVNDAFARGEANFIKVFPAVNACGVAVAFNFEHIKPF